MICPNCGKEFEPPANANVRRKYCTKKCANAFWSRHRPRKARRGKPRDSHRTDVPIPYSPKLAQAAHDRQAEIERKARAEGLSYGKYQMKLYMEKAEK